MTTEQKIWIFLKQKNLSDFAVAGIMGNLQAESGLKSNNLEDTKNKTFGMSDELYTKSVDNGTYKRFYSDSAGYGIAQWTTNRRKRNLYFYCRGKNKSISDLDCQLEFLFQELVSMSLLTKLKQCSSIKDASNIILFDFENPLDKSKSVQDYRTRLSTEFYNRLKDLPIETGGNNNMKYNSSNTPLKCMMTNSSCFKGTRKMDIKGVLWHSTGANNPTLKRYVQPDQSDANYQKLMKLIGRNMLGNDWNHIEIQAGLNAWIGQLADGTVTTLQTMPWSYRPWGCGSGANGSCNDGWIQFEICEDGLNNKEYFEAVYKEACELTAYLCKEYKLNPKGTVNFQNKKVPVILCHQDSARLGLGSNHADVYHWFGRFGKTMENVRNDVAAILANGSSSSIIEEPVEQNDYLMYVRLLKRGRTGDDVKQLQEALIKLGYNLNPYGADGDFGEMTQKAVIKFQEDHNLMADGEAGQNTYDMLNTILSNQKGNTNPSSQEKPNTPIAKNDNLYRVRLSWENDSSQVGAFTKLSTAKKACANAGPGYFVFDSTGKVIFKYGDNPNGVTPRKTNYTDVMIGSASKDERGQYRGGQAGDQTGKEVYINNWYSYNWTNVYRPNDPNLAEQIAQICEDGCANNKIGYSQTDRNTLLAQAKKVGYDMSKITTPCNCDCSSFVSAICVCAGLPESTFFPGGNGCVTSTIGPACLSTGKFSNLTGSKYTAQKSYLKRGDILCNVNAHVVVVLSNGSNA